MHLKDGNTYQKEVKVNIASMRIIKNMSSSRLRGLMSSELLRRTFWVTTRSTNILLTSKVLINNSNTLYNILEHIKENPKGRTTLEVLPIVNHTPCRYDSVRNQVNR